MCPKKVLLLLAALACIGCSGPGRRPGIDIKKLDAIDSVATGAIARGDAPGMVVCVVKDSSIVYLKAFGNKSVYPETAPMTVETVFDMASVSKCMSTTIAVMQLVEHGKLRLADPVKQYIPDFKPWTDPKTGKTVDITVRDVMTHASGLPVQNVKTYISKYEVNTPDSLVKHIALEVARETPPGTCFKYSCLNFVVAQAVVEKITGEKLCDYAANHIFEPLGMNHTRYLPLDREIDPSYLTMIAPTTVQPDGEVLWGQVHDPMARLINQGNSGNAGVFSNAEDLAKMTIALMYGGKGILGPATIDAMCRIPLENDPSVGRAIGWDKLSTHSQNAGDIFDKSTCIMHTGYTGTSFLIDMKSKTAVIILANRVHPQDSDRSSMKRPRALIANIVAGALTEE